MIHTQTGWINHEDDDDKQTHERLIITLCFLEVVVTKRWKSTRWPLGDCDGLPLPRGDPRRRDRWDGAVLWHVAEDLQSQEKGC